jgi:hypothetical protein
MSTIHDSDELVVLDRDKADELAFLLGCVQNWLRQAGDDARDDLAGFLGGAGNRAWAAAGLIDTLDGHAAMLHRRLKGGR